MWARGGWVIFEARRTAPMCFRYGRLLLSTGLLLPAGCLLQTYESPLNGRTAGLTSGGESRPHHGDPLPDGALLRVGAKPDETTDRAFTVAYSPDGRIVAATSTDYSIRLSDAAGRE